MATGKHQPKGEVAKYTDRYGTERVIHNDGRHGLAIKRETRTVTLKLTPIIARLIGQKIRAEREARGYTLEQLANRAGLASGGTPKSRMWEIENSARCGGVRLGTLYAIAIALEISVAALLPTIAEVTDIAPVDIVTQHTLEVAA